MMYIMEIEFNLSEIQFHLSEIQLHISSIQFHIGLSENSNFHYVHNGN